MASKKPDPLKYVKKDSGFMLTPPTRVSPKASPSPMSSEVKAMNNLIAERQAYAKAHGGNYPSDEQLMKSRKKSGM